MDSDSGFEVGSADGGHESSLAPPGVAVETEATGVEAYETKTKKMGG